MAHSTTHPRNRAPRNGAPQPSTDLLQNAFISLENELRDHFCVPTQTARGFVYSKASCSPTPWAGLAETPPGPLCPQTHLVRERFKACPHRVSTAEFGGLKAADDVLEGCGHHKVLLLQPQLLAFEELHLGDTQVSVLKLAAQPLEMLLSDLMGFPTALTRSALCQAKPRRYSSCLSGSQPSSSSSLLFSAASRGQQNLTHHCCSHRPSTAPSLAARPSAGFLEQGFWTPCNSQEPVSFIDTPAASRAHHASRCSVLKHQEECVGGVKPRR